MVDDTRVKKMTRVYNFSAGPACLPEWVLKKAQEEMLDAHGSGMSVMEMSHRSSAFQEILDTCKARLRRLMNIPDDYEILFCQGGGTMQFSMVPLNLLKHSADIINTGQWTKKAIMEHQKLGKTQVIASSAEDNFTYIPKIKQEDLTPDSDYVYICENNTIYGTKFHKLPDTKGKPLVADVSSCFLSEPADITKYGIMYGGVQKNIGPAGVTIVIIRKDLISDDVLSGTPTMMRYKIHTDAKSLYNTPPAYGIYICGKVFRWLLDLGGLPEIQSAIRQRRRFCMNIWITAGFFRNGEEEGPVVDECTVCDRKERTG